MSVSEKSERHMATIDLGSNSFHMIVVSVDAIGHVRVLDKLRESVRLGSGMDDKGNLTEESQQRALDCLHQFGERIRGFASADVAAVGTNTLRLARNARQFLEQAEAALGHPISVISGREEARLIYLGVSHSLAAADDPDARRFVMDIGGGSTELIIGQGYEALHTESLRMGCVSGSLQFFPDGKLDKGCWRKAMAAASLELMPVQRSYREIGWEVANGASGTIKAVRKVIQQLGLAPYGITLEHMREVQARMMAAKTVDKLDLPGLVDERKHVFAGGLAILMSVFEALDINQMLVSDGALREGLVYERVNRFMQSDLRSKTVQNLQGRFQVDVRHAQAVRVTALELFDACAPVWGLPADLRDLLGWAADLHELGLSISHSGYHKHGGYLLDNFDLFGFSTEEQHWLSVLVRTHRRKVFPALYENLENRSFQSAVYLSALLRVAVLLHRSRSGVVALPLSKIKPSKQSLQLVFADDDSLRPLLFVDLDSEKNQLSNVGVKLKYTVAQEEED